MNNIGFVFVFYVVQEIINFVPRQCLIFLRAFLPQNAFQTILLESWAHSIVETDHRE